MNPGMLPAKADTPEEDPGRPGTRKTPNAAADDAGGAAASYALLRASAHSWTGNW